MCPAPGTKGRAPGDPRWLSKRGPSNRPVKLHRWPSPLPRHQNGAPKLTSRPSAGAWPNVTYRAADADAAPTDRVVGLSPLQIQRRFTAAARAAGIEARVTAHSGRVGLASELTARGASTTDVMLA